MKSTDPKYYQSLIDYSKTVSGHEKEVILKTAKSFALKMQPIVKNIKDRFDRSPIKPGFVLDMIEKRQNARNGYDQ